MKAFKNETLFYLFLGLLFFVFRYYEQIFTYWIYAPYIDGSYVLGPAMSNVSKSFLDGETPYMIGNILGGMPIYNSMQFGLYYPFYFFGVFDWGVGVEAQRSMTINSIFHFWILFLNTFVSAKSLKFSNLGSFVSSALMLIAANTGKLALWNNTLASYVWIPLLLASIILIFNKPNKFRGPILMAISALGFTASASQPVIHAVILSIPVGLISFVYSNNRVKGVLKLIFGIFLGILVSAVGILPAVIEYESMLRFVGPGLSTVGFEKLPIEAFMLGDLSHKSWLEVILCPDFLKHGPGHIYIGPIAIILSILGVVKAVQKEADLFQKTLVLVFFFLAMYFLLSSFGNTYNLTNINYHIPLLNKIREPIRNGALCSILFAILAGYSASKLESEYVLKNKSNLFFSAFSIFLILVTFYFEIDKHWISPFLSIVGLTLLLVVGIFLSIYSLVGCRLVIITLIFLNGFLVSRGAPSVVQSQVESLTVENLKSLSILEDLENVIENPIENKLIYSGFKLSNNQFSMNSAYFKLRSLGNLFSPLPNAQKHFMFGDGLNGYQKMFGAKYYVFPSIQESSSLELIKLDKDYALYKDIEAMPRIYIADDFKIFSGSIWNFNETFMKKESPRQVFVDASTLYELVEEDINLNNVVEEFDMSISKIHKCEFEINATDKRFLVFNEFYSKNWKIKINNKTSSLYKINMDQIGFIVNKGHNLVTLEYKPAFFIALRKLQLFGIFLTLAVFLVKRKSL